MNVLACLLFESSVGVGPRALSLSFLGPLLIRFPFLVDGLQKSEVPDFFFFLSLFFLSSVQDHELVEVQTCSFSADDTSRRLSVIEMHCCRSFTQTTNKTLHSNAATCCPPQA